MCLASVPCWRPCFSFFTPCWPNWTRLAPALFALALAATLSACSWKGWADATPAMPSVPVLSSLTRLTLDNAEGVWMNREDAGRLAQWLFDVENF